MLFRRFYQTATVGYALLSNIYYNATALKSKAFDAKKFNACTLLSLRNVLNVVPDQIIYVVKYKIPTDIRCPI